MNPAPKTGGPCPASSASVLVPWTAMRIRRRKGKKEERRLVTGVVWYEDESVWSRMRALATDPERFEETYPAWCRMMEEQLPTLRQAGLLPLKVPMDADEFASWCAREGRDPDASARAEYVSHRLRRLHHEAQDRSDRDCTE